MPRRLLYFGMVLALTACGSPTSPGSIGSHLDTLTPDLKVNGVTIQPGSTTNVNVGARVDLRIDHTNHSGQFLHTALVFVRDDGVERLVNCSVSSSGGQGGGNGATVLLFPEDRGHTARVLLLGAYGPGSGGPPPPCLLASDNFTVNRANVQAERFLMTLVVQ